MAGGRPRFTPTDEQREKVQLRKAVGWSHLKIAAELGISKPTLEQCFAEELASGAARKQGEALDRLWKLAETNVAALKAVKALMLEVPGEDGENKPPSRPVRSIKLGKKEIASIAAKNPDESSPLGRLISLRQNSKEPLN